VFLLIVKILTLKKLLILITFSFSLFPFRLFISFAKAIILFFAATPYFFSTALRSFFEIVNVTFSAPSGAKEIENIKTKVRKNEKNLLKILYPISDF